MKKLIVALWSVPTQQMQNVSLDTRINTLRSAAKQTSEVATKAIASGGGSLSDKPYALFVAPEYFIAMPATGGVHGVGEQRHIEETEKELRLGQLKQISHDYKGIIFVPGTIAWRKPLVRSGAKLYHSKGSQVGQLKTVSRAEKAKDALQFYANRHHLGSHVQLSGPLNVGGGSLRNAPTTHQKLAALEDAGPIFSLGADYVARNTAYVLLDGHVPFKYNKQGDFHEVLKDDGTTVHIPGKLDGRFQMKTSNSSDRPIDFGIEICLDHVFQTTAREIPHLGQVDVQIISSAQVREQKENVAVRPDGYLVHACSNPDYTGVKKQNSSFIFGPWLGKNETFHQDTVGGCQLLFWQIELDLTRQKGN